MKKEYLARLLVILLVCGVMGAAVPARQLAAQDAVNLHGEMADSGGWTPEVIEAQAGKPLHLRLTSNDVIHGFAIGQSDQPAVDIEPGKVTELSLVFDQPGKYTFYCTRWCGLNHWRMRGSIEVSGEAGTSPEAPAPPLYQTLDIELDAPHPADEIPEGRPAASQSRISLSQHYLLPDYYRSHTPSQVFADLRSDPSLLKFSDGRVWDLVASIWWKNTTSQGIKAAQRLYAENCAACHGEGGAGDGVFAAEVQSSFGQKMEGMNHKTTAPADFTNSAAILGASPALLQGKILRGGMGSGMPYWGPIFTDQQTWDLVGYLYSFQFDYSEAYKP